MPKLSKEAKQRLQQLFKGGQFAIRWGFIPVVLYLGQWRQAPACCGPHCTAEGWPRRGERGAGGHGGRGGGVGGQCGRGGRPPTRCAPPPLPTRCAPRACAAEKRPGLVRGPSRLIAVGL